MEMERGAEGRGGVGFAPPYFQTCVMRCCFSALALLPWVLVALDAQLICWQAVFRCNVEPECDLAFRQYVSACEDVIAGATKQCPSHCINALIRLNDTRNGPELESCDCKQDQECLSVQRAIEPCLPRRHPSESGGIGCMEARQRCEENPVCHTSLAAYLAHCGQLFNGRRCSSKCKATIQQMLSIPNGELLNQCICDGVERPFCEVVKENMSKLCSIGDPSDVTHTPDYSYDDENDEGPPLFLSRQPSFYALPACKCECPVCSLTAVSHLGRLA
uniref:GDNF/GAS1 domain-containing protein n=1 Tax=Oryzias sinensis TaxID=183150 RepID=A0A8C7ZU84_9TELE